MNKCLNVIGILLVLLLFPYCGGRETQPSEGKDNNAHAALAEIDSLMWRQPDSAFVLLQEFVVSPEAEVLDTFDGHYCQMLISELLYKNYKQQSNRDDLLQAVDYFDSLTTNTQGMFSQECIVFLDARAHYINGAGFYEKGDVVHACTEYLKALEVMEKQWEEKALTGKRAVFMFYTYNRLLELFSAQFMMDPAITCCEKALAYCQNEPSLSKEIPNTYFHMGKQYDKKGEKDVAKSYYERAIEGMTNTNSPIYRDAVSMKALCDYQIGLDAEQSLNTIKQALANAQGEKEKIARFLVIGSIFSEEGIYDSALHYYGLAFENEINATAKIRAAENMRIIYDSLGDRENSNKYMRFLTDHKELEGNNKALVSKLEDLFKTYTSQKQEKQTIEERKKSIKKAITIIVPIAIAVILAIIVLAKLRSKILLKEQKEEADRMLGKTEQLHKEELRLKQAEAEKTLEDKEKHHQQEMEAKEAQARKELEERDKQHAEVLEAERQTHRMEQAAISGRLKRSNQEVRELKNQIKQLDDLAAKTEVAASFDEEPICRLIMERVNEGQFKSKIDYIFYKDFALDKQQLLDLRLAVDRHFGQFTIRLKKAYPELTNSDLDYCCLYLLGLTDADIAALMQRTYNTVFQRNGKMRKIFSSENPLPITLMGLAKDSLFI